MSCVARPYAEKFEQPADYWMDTMFQQQQQRGSFFLPPFMHADQSHIDQSFNNEMSGFYHNADNSGTSSPVSDFSPESSPLSECYSPVEDDYQAVWSFNQPIFSSYPSQEVHFYHPEPIYRDASAYGMVAPAPSASFVQPKETSAFAPVERVYNPQPAAPVIAAAKDSAAREAVDDADAAKQRISWTHELHTAFLRAYDTLGDEATPKKIMFIMRAQGVCMKSITRSKVASHLQRHEKKLGLARRPSVTKKSMSGAPSKDKSQSQAE